MYWTNRNMLCEESKQPVRKFLDGVKQSLEHTGGQNEGQGEGEDDKQQYVHAVFRAGGRDETTCEEEVTNRAMQNVDLQGALTDGGEQWKLPVGHQSKKCEAHKSGNDKPDETDQPKVRDEGAWESGRILCCMETIVPGAVDDIFIRIQVIEALGTDQYEAENAEHRQNQYYVSIGTLRSLF